MARWVGGAGGATGPGGARHRAPRTAPAGARIPARRRVDGWNLRAGVSYGHGPAPPGAARIPLSPPPRRGRCTPMPLFEAVRLALSQIRAQKLKSFFTLLGVTIGTMFIIAVVSVVNGMGRYVEEDFAAKFLGVNTFNLRRFPDINMGEVTQATWREWMKRPR